MFHFLLFLFALCSNVLVEYLHKHLHSFPINHPTTFNSVQPLIQAFLHNHLLIPITFLSFMLLLSTPSFTVRHQCMKFHSVLPFKSRHCILIHISGLRHLPPCYTFLDLALLLNCGVSRCLYAVHTPRATPIKMPTSFREAILPSMPHAHYPHKSVHMKSLDLSPLARRHRSLRSFISSRTLPSSSKFSSLSNSVRMYTVLTELQRCINMTEPNHTISQFTYSHIWAENAVSN